MTLPRMIAFILATLLPLANIVLGVMMLVGGLIINGMFIITYVVLPLLAIFLLGLLLFSEKTIAAKSILSVLLLLLFVGLFLVMSMFVQYEQLRSYEKEEVAQRYARVEKDFSLMPSLSEIGEPTNVEYHDYYTSFLGIFNADVNCLVCGYSDVEYAVQKEQIEKTYVFQSGELEWVNGTEIEMDGYKFRLLSEEKYNLFYPKYMMCIATNDDTNEIVYLYFVDDDQDYIASLEDFINESCGWEHIR
jgi:hypothetical protein